MSNLSYKLSEQDKMILSNGKTDSLVSVFADIKHSRKPICTLDLRKVLFSTKNQDRILHLRTLEKGSEDFQRLKQSLPCYTPSGLFLERNYAGLIRHSGFLCIEWDRIDPEEIKNTLSRCNFIYYAGLSCSGKGVFAIVRIADPALHGEYFRALKSYFDEKNMPIDKSGSDVPRLRVASYDPDPVFNEDSAVWDETLPPVHYPPATTFGADIQQKLFLCGYDYIRQYAVDITAGRNNWLALGSTIKTLFGDGGEDYYVSISQFHPEFSEQECRKTFRSLHIGNFGIGVFCSACTRAGMPELKTLYSKISNNKSYGPHAL